MIHPSASNGPPRRSLTVWAIGGLIALIAVLAIGAVGSFLYYGIHVFNEQAHAAIRADPAVRAALGNNSRIELDLSATGNAPGAEDFAYRVSGDRASGLLVGRFVTISADAEELRSGQLTLDDGRRILIGTGLLRASDRLSGDRPGDGTGGKPSHPLH
jgi:hypothetical protein